MTKKPELVFVALGGAGEIGMNMYLYGVGSGRDRRWIMVDCGVSFGDMESSPGVEVIMPDPAFIEAEAERLQAIFITHAHEDHVGAIGRLWPRLRAPVYARPFTARFAALKMEEAGQDPGMIRPVGAWPETVEAGPFRVAFLPVSHSVPESSALLIEAGGHRVLHTGDFKIDRTPPLGEPFDEALFAEIAAGGIDALVCDSTNVFSDHPGRSEAEVAEPIAELIARAPGLVVATSFASNLARLRTIAHAARAAGRAVQVRGRAMKRMIGLAQEAGILTDFPETVGDEAAAEMPAERLLVLASGSQGERRAAMSQIAFGANDRVRLQEGDLVLFSSKTIPGNEKAVARVFNRLSELGARMVDDQDGLYHVSGHANRPDLAAMHRLVAPKLLVPMHGEHRHLVAHAELARASGIAAVVAPNGTLVRLAGGEPGIAGSVETGRLYLDGSLVIGAEDGVVRERLRLAMRGHVVAAVVVDQHGELAADPVVEVIGLMAEVDDEVPDLAVEIESVIELAFDRAERRELRSDEAIERMVATACSQLCNRLIGRKPLVTVLVSRVETE
ncbi:MAG: ribonuclease J [Alphaproteobacteria bacterium]|nr:MAG: ribonuclease J [Alphaproteobacteria bacterium]